MFCVDTLRVIAGFVTNWKDFVQVCKDFNKLALEFEDQKYDVYSSIIKHFNTVDWVELWRWSSINHDDPRLQRLMDIFTSGDSDTDETLFECNEQLSAALKQLNEEPWDNIYQYVTDLVDTQTDPDVGETLQYTISEVLSKRSDMTIDSLKILNTLYLAGYLDYHVFEDAFRNIKEPLSDLMIVLKDLLLDHLSSCEYYPGLTREMVEAFPDYEWNSFKLACNMVLKEGDVEWLLRRSKDDNDSIISALSYNHTLTYDMIKPYIDQDILIPLDQLLSLPTFTYQNIVDMTANFTFIKHNRSLKLGILLCPNLTLRQKATLLEA